MYFYPGKIVHSSFTYEKVNKTDIVKPSGCNGRLLRDKTSVLSLTRCDLLFHVVDELHDNQLIMFSGYCISIIIINTIYCVPLGSVLGPFFDICAKLIFRFIMSYS